MKGLLSIIVAGWRIRFRQQDIGGGESMTKHVPKHITDFDVNSTYH